MQSLRNKLGMTEIFLDKESPDFFCVNEHWMLADEIQFISFANHTLKASYCRNDEKHHGGVAIYTKCTDQLDEILEINKLCTPKDFECCGIKNKDKKYNIISIYRTPDGNFDDFILKLEELLNILSHPEYLNFICGDINLDTLPEKKSELVITMHELLDCYGHFATINTPTRITKNSSTSIDEIITNYDDNNSKDFGTISSMLSDHEAVYITADIGVSSTHKTPERILRRINSEANYSYFRFLLSSEPWENVMQCRDTNVAYNYFVESLSYYFNIAFPAKPCKEKNSNTTPRWMNYEIKKQTEVKRFLFQQSRNNNDNEELLQQYKSYSKHLTKEIDQTMRMCNDSAINNAPNRTKKMWEIIKPKKNDKGKKKLNLKIDGSLQTNPEKIATHLNHYFNDITDNLNLSSPKFNRVYSSPVTNSFFVQPINVEETLQHINSLKNKNSSGWDEISNNLLKKSADIIATPLTHLINLSFENGVFPEQLKKTIIKPVFKRDDSTDANNYRPIALLSSISKIFEKAMCSRLNSFLQAKNIICQEQNGFQKGKSTELAVFQSMMEIMEAVENRKLVVNIFCDLSKAFDCVNHPLLLHKLEQYGIRGTPYNWFESYLKCRRQSVEVNGVKSDEIATKHGVPQGSILGPLLFIIYINDLPQNFEEKMVLLADDTSLVVKCQDITTLNSQVAELLKKLETFFTENTLCLNIKKTQALVYGRSDIKNVGIAPYKINIENQSLKFLGLYTDNHLNWTSHIEHTRKKLKSYSFLIRRLAKTCTKEAALSAYHGYIHSRLKYGIIFYGARPEATKLFRMQKRCIRNIVGAGFRDTCKPIFESLEILTFPSLYFLEAACFVKKHYQYFADYENLHSYNTRHKTMLYIPPCNFASTRKGVFIQLMKVYNQVPPEIRVLSDKKFKNALKKLLLKEKLYKLNLEEPMFQQMATSSSTIQS